MLKYYITVLFQEFTRTLKQFFFTYLGQNQKKLKKKKKSETCIPVWFEQLKELNHFF